MTQVTREQFVKQLAIASKIGLKFGVFAALALLLYFLWLGPTLNVQSTFMQLSVHGNLDYQIVLREAQENADKTFGKGTEYGLDGFDLVHRWHYYTKPTFEFRIPYAVLTVPLALIDICVAMPVLLILLCWAVPASSKCSELPEQITHA